MKKILITGAAGNVGKVIWQSLKGRGFSLRLADIINIDGLDNDKDVEFIHMDILDLEKLQKAMQGIDCVIHLAAIPRDVAWDKLEAINIHGTYNIFEAARKQKVKRVIFASTNQVIGFYRNDRIIDNEVYPRPASFYGVTKVCGEALARLYSDKYGIEVACLRIGSLEERPTEMRHLSTWLSYRDLVQLVVKCIEGKYHFIIIYGVSANTRSHWNNAAAKKIGYLPEDNAEMYAGDLSLKEVRNEIGKQFQGGQFCSADFCGDSATID